MDPSGDNRVLIEIVMPKGTKVLNLKEQGRRRFGESEFLLPRGSQFEAISINKALNKVKLRLIP